MQPVAADQREEGGQEGAALRACAAGDHVGKLVDLESEERRPEHERHHSAQIQVGTAPFSERLTRYAVKGQVYGFLSLGNSGINRELRCPVK